MKAESKDKESCKYVGTTREMSRMKSNHRSKAPRYEKSFESLNFIIICQIRLFHNFARFGKEVPMIHKVYLG